MWKTLWIVYKLAIIKIKMWKTCELCVNKVLIFLKLNYCSRPVCKGKSEKFGKLTKFIKMWNKFCKKVIHFFINHNLLRSN